MSQILAWALASLLILVTVSIHYEVMLTVSDRVVPWLLRHSQGRRVIAIAVGVLMLGHIMEIWLFAATYAMVSLVPSFGGIVGDFDGSINSFLYFSAVNYTSLGDNAFHPVGAARNLAAAETLAGMMMIAWSASFTYLKMEQVWQSHRNRKRKPPRPDA